MTKKGKRIKKITQNPKNVRFKTLHTLLLSQGFEVRQPASGSSHYIYFKDTIKIVIPFKKPFIKEIYVKAVLDALGRKI